MSDPSITTVAELEPYGLSKRSLELLDKMGFVTLDDMEELTSVDIWSHNRGGEVTIKDIREALRNYLAGRIVRTKEDMWFPNQYKRRKKK